jgi:ribosomal protein L11 methyltransferase
MKHYECIFSYLFEKSDDNNAEMFEIVSDVLAAEMGEIGFDSFMYVDGELSGFVPEDLFDPELVKKKLEEFPLDGVRISFIPIMTEELNWNEEWERNYFRPVVIGSDCIVHATFHNVDPGYRYDIIVDPKMSFGTGNHETTHLMLYRMIEMDLSAKSVLDMGCGTGVLAILAAMKGAENVQAVDIDEWAYRNAVENAALNKVSIDVRLGDAGIIPDSPVFDVLLANINRNILLADIKSYAAAMKSGGIFLASGFYTEDVPAIVNECAAAGLVFVDRSEKNNWAMVEARKE